jgi:thiol-disulfide isomerase/thioredoxin
MLKLQMTLLAALTVVAACASPNNDKDRARPAAATKKVELVPAPADGEVAALVQKELTRAKGDGRQLLVYVGATWCEPCRNFHAAAASGKLDATLGTLRLLEFDADRDNERLAVAGYFSRYIPLFALPNGDGRASGKQIEGATKGSDVALTLGPQLKGLLQ